LDYRFCSGQKCTRGVLEFVSFYSIRSYLIHQEPCCFLLTELLPTHDYLFTVPAPDRHPHNGKEWVGKESAGRPASRAGVCCVSFISRAIMFDYTGPSSDGWYWEEWEGCKENPTGSITFLIAIWAARRGTPFFRSTFSLIGWVIVLAPPPPSLSVLLYWSSPSYCFLFFCHIRGHLFPY